MSQDPEMNVSSTQNATSTDKTSSTQKPKQVFTMLENNPSVMNPLAQNLGLSSNLCFRDIYSLSASELQYIPRPVDALLTLIPMTDAWRASREAEDLESPSTTSSQPFFAPQTIIHGCGLLGLIHILANVAADQLTPDSLLSSFLAQAMPLSYLERAKLLEDSDALYHASEAVANLGDSRVLRADEEGAHFVALVKGKDGCLWELEGSRKGPLNRGRLPEGEDLLSEEGLKIGLGRLMKLQGGNEELGVSCIALSKGD